MVCIATQLRCRCRRRLSSHRLSPVPRKRSPSSYSHFLSRYLSDRVRTVPVMLPAEPPAPLLLLRWVRHAGGVHTLAVLPAVTQIIPPFAPWSCVFVSRDASHSTVATSLILPSESLLLLRGKSIPFPAEAAHYKPRLRVSHPPSDEITLSLFQISSANTIIGRGPDVARGKACLSFLSSLENLLHADTETFLKAVLLGSSLHAHQRHPMSLAVVCLWMSWATHAGLTNRRAQEQRQEDPRRHLF